MNEFNVHKVLVIDDEAVILKVLSKMLSKKGYCIDTADNGAVAMNKAVSNDYDFVMTDIRMPGISGEEILHQLKSLKGSGIPVIGMSGTPWLLDENLFDAVINKPFTMKELFETIERIAPPKNMMKYE